MNLNRDYAGRRIHLCGLFRVRISLLSVIVFCACVNVFLATWHEQKSWEEYKSLSPTEIALVKHKAGIYIDGAKANDFENVVLLTAGNFGYITMYRNWACHAQRLGLKWILVASDKQIYDAIGPDEAILSQNAATATSKATKFRDAGFNRISCSKLIDVLRISQSANVDVVFSDCDNVFRTDPFSASASLGSAIRSRLYDYVYQHNQKQSTWTTEPREGNTGFYYISGRRKRVGFRHLYFRALQTCEEKPEMDDQANFWNVFREMRSGEAYANLTARAWLFERHGTPFKLAKFCPPTKISDESILSYCSLDPYQHPVGLHDELGAFVTYHANYRVGHESKVERLKELGLWFDNACTL